jgi:hypothetical protein
MEVIPIQASIQDNGRAYVIIIPKYGGFFNGIAKNKKSATGETFIGRQQMTVITGLIVWIGSNSGITGQFAFMPTIANRLIWCG